MPVARAAPEVGSAARRRDADQHAGTRFAPTTLRVTLSAVLARSHLAGAALLHRRRHGDDTASPMASPWACPARRPTLRSIRRPTVRPARRRPTVAPETASDCSTDPSANALDGARAAGAQSLALCAPDTGNDTGCPIRSPSCACTSAYQIRILGVPNPRLEPRCVCVRVWRPERRSTFSWPCSWPSNSLI